MQFVIRSRKYSWLFTLIRCVTPDNTFSSFWRVLILKQLFSTLFSCCFLSQGFSTLIASMLQFSNINVFRSHISNITIKLVWVQFYNHFFHVDLYYREGLNTTLRIWSVSGFPPPPPPTLKKRAENCQQKRWKICRNK